MQGEHLSWNLPKYSQYPTERALLNDLVFLTRCNLPKIEDQKFIKDFGIISPHIVIVGQYIELYGCFRKGDAKRAKRFFQIRQNEDGTWDVEYWGYGYGTTWS
jgi:hypothetical protein